MVGACAMPPERIELNTRFADESEEETRDRIASRLQEIGLQIMNSTGGGDAFHHDPISSVLRDRDQRRMVAQHLGDAYIKAYNLVRNNKEAIEKIADMLAERREIFGNELLQILDDANLQMPEIDLAQEAAWPKL